MIRKLNENDIDRVMSIWLESNKRAHNFIPKEYWDNNYNTVKTMVKNSEVYVHLIDDHIVGFIGVMENYIAGIFVDINYCRMGIGKALIDHVKLTRKKLDLYVYAKNKNALKFYLNQNFIKIEEKLDEYHNEIEDHMLWTK